MECGKGSPPQVACLCKIIQAGKSLFGTEPEFMGKSLDHGDKRKGMTGVMPFLWVPPAVVGLNAECLGSGGNMGWRKGSVDI